MHRDFVNIQENQILIEKSGKGYDHIIYSLKPQMAKHYMNNAYLSGENQIKNNKIVCYIFIGFFLTR